MESHQAMYYIFQKRHAFSPSYLLYLSKNLFHGFSWESKSATSNLSEPRNAEDHLGLNQNEEPIACFNTLREEVLRLKTQISELRVTYYCRNARRAIRT